MDNPHEIRGAHTRSNVNIALRLTREWSSPLPCYFQGRTGNALPDRCRQLSCTLFPVPLFDPLSRTKSTVTIFMLCFAGLLMLSGFTSIHMLVKTELFPARIRALAVGLPYALTTAILGGTADLSRCGSRRPATSRTSSGTSQSGPPYRCSSIYECLKPMSGKRQ